MKIGHSECPLWRWFNGLFIKTTYPGIEEHGAAKPWVIELRANGFTVWGQILYWLGHEITRSLGKGRLVCVEV